MMNEITVSVIVPCFNDGRYLTEAIDSVQLSLNRQTEIIIVDDGSDDAWTFKVLEQIADERIRVFHTHRKGPSEARNEGIRHARGKYILPLDADDRIEPSYISKALKILQENSSIGVVYCYASLFGKASGRWKLPDYSLERMLLDNVVFVTAMFRKADWEKLGGFRNDMKNGLEDYDFFLGILELGKEIYQIPEVLFHYRIKRVSRTTQFLAEKDAVKEAYRMIYEHHPKLYREYAQIHAQVLRNALIDQKYKLKWLRDVKARVQQIVSRILYRG